MTTFQMRWHKIYLLFKYMQIRLLNKSNFMQTTVKKNIYSLPDIENITGGKEISITAKTAFPTQIQCLNSIVREILPIYRITKTCSSGISFIFIVYKKRTWKAFQYFLFFCHFDKVLCNSITMEVGNRNRWKPVFNTHWSKAALRFLVIRGKMGEKSLYYRIQGRVWGKVQISMHFVFLVYLFLLPIYSFNIYFSKFLSKQIEITRIFLNNILKRIVNRIWFIKREQKVR